MRDGKARVPTTDEIERALAVIREGAHAERNTAIFMLSYALGLRVHEIAKLKIGHVWGYDGSLRVSFTINGKGKKNREIFLSNERCNAALADYMSYLRATRRDLNREAPLFVSQKRRSFTPNNMGRVFATIYERAGLEGCKSHSGRRSFATRLLEDGRNLRAVQKLLGHERITTTGEYADTDPNKLKDLIARAI